MAGALTISTLNNDTGSLATQNGMPGIVKAWLQFINNGSGGGTINASYNVSSVTYSATGRYTVNFTTALPNSAYAGYAHCNQLGVLTYCDNGQSTTSFGFGTYTNTFSGYVPANNTGMFVAIFSN